MSETPRKYRTGTEAAPRKYPTGADILVENHGSICLLRPLRDSARAWLEDHVAADAQWWGGGIARALVVEPRYLVDIVVGARAAGLEVR